MIPELAVGPRVAVKLLPSDFGVRGWSLLFGFIHQSRHTFGTIPVLDAFWRTTVCLL